MGSAAGSGGAESCFEALDLLGALIGLVASRFFNDSFFGLADRKGGFS
jgi:hypothetical protein